MSIYIWDKEVKEIYCGTKESFTPWANTIYYFPLDTDATDHSWHWYTLSNTWTATTLWRNFTSSVTTSPSGSTISNAKFRMMWIKINNVWYQSQKTNSATMNVDDWFNLVLMSGWVGQSRPITISYYYQSWSSYATTDWQPNLTTWNWYCIAFQNEWTEAVAYCNWVRHVMATWKTGYSWGNQWILKKESTTTWMSVDISEIILESATRTQSQIVNYFNDTKSMYWVS